MAQIPLPNWAELECRWMERTRQRGGTVAEPFGALVELIGAEYAEQVRDVDGVKVFSVIAGRFITISCTEAAFRKLADLPFIVDVQISRVGVDS